MEQKLINEILKIDNSFADNIIFLIFLMVCTITGTFYLIKTNPNALIIICFEFIAFMAITNGQLRSAEQQRKVAICELKI